LVFLLASAQLVQVIPASAMLRVLGVLIAVFAALQLLGWQPRLSRPTVRTEAAVGAIAGLTGGFSGVWGPPTVAYLTALNTSKADQIRVQGVIYGLGAVALAGAHVGSGVLTWATAPLSAALVLPALAGMWVGTMVQERINQATFRRATLAILLLAGLNLLRKGMMG
jgi:uncharacterized membrane protein YfcA